MFSLRRLSAVNTELGKDQSATLRVRKNAYIRFLIDSGAEVNVIGFAEEEYPP